MTSSDSFGLLSMLLVLHFILVPVSVWASTKYIDAICHAEWVRNRSFCSQTLTEYPPAVSATDLFPLVEIVFRLGRSHALKTAAFAAEVAKKEPKLKTKFKLCNDTYMDLEQNFRIGILDLKVDPKTGNYDAMISYDKTKYIDYLIGKNTDDASKRLMEMTAHMNKLLEIVVGATEAWEDHESKKKI